MLLSSVGARSALRSPFFSIKTTPTTVPRRTSRQRSLAILRGLTPRFTEMRRSHQRRLAFPSLRGNHEGEPRGREAAAEGIIPVAEEEEPEECAAEVGTLAGCDFSRLPAADVEEPAAVVEGSVGQAQVRERHSGVDSCLQLLPMAICSDDKRITTLPLRSRVFCSPA